MSECVEINAMEQKKPYNAVHSPFNSLLMSICKWGFLSCTGKQHQYFFRRMAHTNWLKARCYSAVTLLTEYVSLKLYLIITWKCRKL